MKSEPSPPETARERARTLARKYGWNATTFQTLGPGFRYFFVGDGYVAYADTGASWIAAGAPVCPPGAIYRTTLAFLAEARSQKKRAVFFGAEPPVLDATEGLLDSIQIGEQPVWDPRDWATSLASHSSLRAQFRRARAKGVTVLQVDDEQRHSLESEVNGLVARWLATRSMPEMGFLVTVRTLFGSGDATHFVAWRDGHAIGLATVIPVPGRNGLFIEHLVRDPSAPNGTVELLVDAVFTHAASAGATWLTLGLAPLAGRVPEPLRLARHRLRWLYDFEGLHHFKAKLRPHHWIPISLAYPPIQGALTSTLDALRAFAAEGFFRFGLRFLSIGHPLVLTLLALLLVPWTLLLALASPGAWFAGNATIQYAWVAFDTLIVFGLFRLVRRPSWKLALGLALAASADAILTPLEAIAWNVPRLHTGLEVVIVLLACLAPCLAAFVLWGTASRLRSLQVQ